MYGLVNRAIEELVVATAGADAWTQVCDRAGTTHRQFVAMSPYDDAITYDLVAAASEVLDTPAEQLLEAFGRHWILYTGANGWGPVLDSCGSTVAEVVHNLDGMHERVKATMPEMRVPSFGVENDGDDLIVHYRSPRDGLAAMVLGLLRGLAERCEEGWTVSQIGVREADGFDTFRLSPVEVTASVGD